MPRIRAAVEDAVGRVKEHAVPYFERVAQWAGTRMLPGVLGAWDLLELKTENARGGSRITTG